MALHSRARDRGVVAVALVVFVEGARAARYSGVTHAELRFFQLINGLPRRAFVPVWVVMQFGSLSGALGTGAATGAVGGRALGTRVGAAGSLTWLAVKAVKPFIRRDRPALAFDATRVLGRAQGGLGYPSGHAAVATAMATVAAPALPRRWRPLAWALALVVGPARMYVGAHLPLDVLGGTALGVAVGTAWRLAEDSVATGPG